MAATAVLVLAVLHAGLIAPALRIDGIGAPVRQIEADVSARLLSLEESCTSRAEQALELATRNADPALLSEALERLAGDGPGGIEILDSEGVPLAWAGEPLREGLPSEPSTALVGIDEAAALLVVRERAGRRATCHLPLRVTGAPYGFASETAQRHLAASVAIEPAFPGAAGDGIVRSLDGTALARVLVASFEDADAVRDTRALRRKQTLTRLVLALVLVGFTTLWFQGRSLALVRRVPHRWVTLVRAAGVGAAWWAFEGLRWDLVFGEGSLASPDAYAGGFADSPLALLIRCGAVAALCGLTRSAVRHGRDSRLPLWAAIVAVGAVALGARIGLDALVSDMVENSAGVLFPEDSILPRAPGMALLGAVALAGLAGLELVRATARLVALDRRVSGPRGALTALFLGALAAPTGPIEATTLWGLAALSAAAFGLALLVLLRARTVALSLALVPMLLALGAQAPVQRALAADRLNRVATAADNPASDASDLAVLKVGTVLEEMRERLVRTVPTESGGFTEGLARSLWTGSSMRLEGGGSGVVIRPVIGAASVQVAGSLLPPENWLPDPSELDVANGPVVMSLAGRGSGATGRWAVGRAAIETLGRVVGHLEVYLEWQRPEHARLEGLELLARRAPADTRSDPAVTVVRFDADGRPRGTSTPSRSLAVVPDDAVLAQVAASGGSRVLSSNEGGRAVGVLVRRAPDTEDAPVVEAIEFETDGAWDLALAAAKALLAGALIASLALLGSVHRWWPQLRRRLANRVVVLLALVSAVPLLALAWVAEGQVYARAASAADRALRESAVLTDVALRQRFGQGLEGLANEGSREVVLRALAFGMGHHAAVYTADGTLLIAASDSGLVASGILPSRLPAAAHRDCVLRERPFASVARLVAKERFEVGFAPVLSADGRRMAILAVPFPDVRRTRDRELAGAVTAVLGLSLLTLIAAVGLGSWLSRRVTAPLRELTVATHRVLEGDLSKPVPSAGLDELGQVVDAFNRMLADLDESQRRLVSAEKEAAWRDMARQVAHEVKNPLTPMRLAAQHLERAHGDGAADFDQILAKSVAVIVRQTDKLQRIVTAFRDFARLPDVRREPVDVGALVAHVLDLYARIPDLRRDVTVADGLPTVSADPEELERVLVNLVGNAVEALSGTPGRVTARVASAGGHVSIEIEDDGPGIPAETLPRLFEPSFSTKTGGTGLGLAICKRAIEDLGGTIAIDSREGAGTTVSITLPALSDSLPIRPHASASPPPIPLCVPPAAPSRADPQETEDPKAAPQDPGGGRDRSV